MSEYIDQDSIYNCNEETLDDEGYFVKKDWDEWLSEWSNHHYRNEIMKYIREREKKKLDVKIDKNVQDQYEKYVLIDASVSDVYLNRELLRRRCINIARTMRKTLGKNKQDLYDFKHDKELTGLKYTNIRTKVNFIQITVIIVSTIITFLETMKDKFGLTNNISMTIAPILLSTYIGLALAISRFFKLDDHKEELCKLDEAQSFVISGLRHRARMIQSMMPLYCDPDVDTRKRGKDGQEIEEINVDRQTAILDYFSKVEKIIEDQSIDGLEETMSNCKQKFDLVMNLSEKVYYKNILLTISIDEDIVDGNKKLLNLADSKVSLTRNESDIKKEQCCIWKYICCLCCDCKYHYIDKGKALNLVERDLSWGTEQIYQYATRKRKEAEKGRINYPRSGRERRNSDSSSDADSCEEDIENNKSSQVNNQQNNIVVQGRRRRAIRPSSVSKNDNNYAKAFTAYNRCNTAQNMLENTVQENTIISEKQEKQENDEEDIEVGENDNNI